MRRISTCLLRAVRRTDTSTYCVYSSSPQLRFSLCQLARFGASAAPEPEPREVLQYDVCIVGAGPAGLAAAIRLKQQCEAGGKDLSVCVLEKGAEVGAHILSGNVLETRALDELLPDWKELDAPIHTRATLDRFYFLTEKRRLRLPTPPQMANKKKQNYVVSLSQVVRWLAGQAESRGVEIYPGFAASEVLYGRGGVVTGVATRDMGIAKDGSHKSTYARGVELQARATLFAEGCRGSLSEGLIKRFRLREAVGADPQTYALGIKEVWQVDPAKHKPGVVWHTVGYPLDQSTYGGSFLYHMGENNQVALGLVVALDYRDPYLSPYQEFQRWKAHPAIRPLLEGGSVVQYGARTLNEGGAQSVPKLDFPGGALIGCSAGFLNVPKIKGTHTAMKSGMLAAEAVYEQLARESSAHHNVDLSSYDAALRESWVWDELQGCRNIRPGFKWGLWPGITLAGLDTYVMGGKAPWTLHHRHPDHAALLPASEFTPREYPPPDNEVTFPLSLSLYRSSTNHDHDQPSHLRLRNKGIPQAVNLPTYAGPESRYCPAGVYEYVPDEHGNQALQINAQNCLHCKACDVKDPLQNIEWTVPEGGGGPAYTVM